MVITVTPEDRKRLEAIARDRNARGKHVARAKVILATADGSGTVEIMRARTGARSEQLWSLVFTPQIRDGGYRLAFGWAMRKVGRLRHGAPRPEVARIPRRAVDVCST